MADSSGVGNGSFFFLNASVAEEWKKRRQICFSSAPCTAQEQCLHMQHSFLNQPSQNIDWCTSHKLGERIWKGSGGGAVRFNSCTASPAFEFNLCSLVFWEARKKTNWEYVPLTCILQHGVTAVKINNRQKHLPGMSTWRSRYLFFNFIIIFFF